MLRMSIFMILGAALLITAIYRHRDSAVWLLHDFMHRPKRISFLEHRGERVHIYSVRNPALTARMEAIAVRISKNLFDAEKKLSFRMTSPLKVYLYSNWEEKGNHVRDIRIAHADPETNSVHCIVDDRFDGTKERLEYQILMQLKYGKPFHSGWGEITAAAFSGIWNQNTLNEWVTFLMARELGPEFPLLFTSNQVSIYHAYPWNALFLGFLNETYGWDQVVEMYRFGRAPSGYEMKWKNYVSRLPGSSGTDRKAFRPEFQKGVSYAYLNSYDRGYATEKSGESLDRLRRIGVNWIAAIPYGYMKSAHSEELHYAGHSIIGESDESMLAVVKDAKSRGMKVMMKPQIWISHGSWPGAIRFEDEESWKSWHSNYERWILHYAILAELIEADAFCVGTEFVRATLEHPKEWRQIIRTVRKVFSGPVVYAANHGQEFEEISFWDELDYIGLNNYYTVRPTPDTGWEEMKQAFHRQREKIRSVALRYEKPLLFTEIGYTATQNSGMSLRESESGDYDEFWQDQCYQMAFETYWNEPWFFGYYWWKWFSDPSDRGTNADKHSPHGRASEKILKLWYQKPR